MYIINLYILEVTVSLNDSPYNGYKLFPRRAPEFIIYSMLQNPYDYSNKKKETSSDNPHKFTKWPQESPSTRIHFLKWGHNKKSR